MLTTQHPPITQRCRDLGCEITVHPPTIIATSLSLNRAQSFTNLPYDKGLVCQQFDHQCGSGQDSKHIIVSTGANAHEASHVHFNVFL